jgi:hypothetical protein
MDRNAVRKAIMQAMRPLVSNSHSWRDWPGTFDFAEAALRAIDSTQPAPVVVGPVAPVLAPVELTVQPPIGCIVVQDADVVPHVHPDYGPGLFFTEDAVITSPQPPRLALDRREPVVWIDFHADPTLRPLVSIGAKPPPLWPDAEPLYRAIVELPPPLQIAEPAGHIYAECRECQSCGHIGINDASDSLAACTNCDWSGDSPKEDHCPGCESDGTMTAACPKCGARYNLLADAELPVTPKEPS